MRGKSERISAALWFSDLMNYTKISDSAPPEEILPDSIVKLKDWDKKLEISDWEAAAEAKKPKPAAAAAKH